MVNKIVLAAGGPNLALPTFSASFKPQVSRLVKSSIAWHALHHEQYLSCEFEVIYPVPSHVGGPAAAASVTSPFDEETMEDVGTHKGGVEAVAVLGLGLKQVKLKRDGEGKAANETIVLRKAQVTTESLGGEGVLIEIEADGATTPKAGSA